MSSTMVDVPSLQRAARVSGQSSKRKRRFGSRALGAQSSAGARGVREARPETSSCATAVRAIIMAVGFWICISRNSTFPSCARAVA